MRPELMLGIEVYAQDGGRYVCMYRGKYVTLAQGVGDRRWLFLCDGYTGKRGYPKRELALRDAMALVDALLAGDYRLCSRFAWEPRVWEEEDSCEQDSDEAELESSDGLSEKDRDRLELLSNIRKDRGSSDNEVEKAQKEIEKIKSRLKPETAP